MTERTVFDTRALPPHQRFGAWRDSIGVLFDVDTRAGEADRFNARVETWMLDGVVLNRCTSSAQAFRRPSSRYVEDGVDHYMIQLFLSGQCAVRRGARAAERPPGAIVGFDLAETLDSTNADFDLLNLFIPRRRLAPLLRRPDSIHGLQVDPEAGAGPLLADYFQSLYATAGSLSPEESAGAAEVLMRLIAAAFNGAPAPAHDPPAWADHAVALKARRYISQNLADPDLSPETIAAAAGVSRARLYRAFSGVGGVSRLIQDLRLRRCLTDLLSPGLAHLHVAQIGYRWGFQRPDHFSRAFRDRFGVAPGEARARGAVALDRRRSAEDGALDRRYESWIATIG